VASTGLDPDTWTELEEWRTERGLKRSEGTRRLLITGLEAEKEEEPPNTTLSTGLLWAGSFLIATKVEWTLRAVSSDVIPLAGLLLILIGAALRTNWLRNKLNNR
jgi:hypothetical protein